MDETKGGPWATLIGTREGPPDANGFATFHFETIRADGLTDRAVMFSEIRVRVGGRWSTLSYVATSPSGEWQSKDDARVSITFTDAQGATFTAEHPGFDVRRKESGGA